MTLAALLRREVRAAARSEIKPVAAEVRQLRRLLRQLRQVVRRQAAALRRYREVGAARPVRRKLTLSRERRAQLKLQGQYMGHLRGLRPQAKAQVKAARSTRGLEQAIRLAQRLRGA